MKKEGKGKLSWRKKMMGVFVSIRLIFLPFSGVSYIYKYGGYFDPYNQITLIVIMTNVKLINKI